VTARLVDARPGDAGAGAESLGRYLRERFPLATHVVPVLATFGCMHLALDARGGAPLSWPAATSAVTFVLLFLQLRAVDDLDDLRAEVALGRVTRREARPRLRAMGLAFTLGVLLVTALNWRDAAALTTALAAAAGMVVTPFVLRTLLTGRAVSPAPTTGHLVKDLVLAPCFEGVPLLIMLYVYLAWSSDAGAALPSPAVVSLVGTFWLTYEFWKYSRYLHRPGWRPYGLGWPAAQAGLLVILILALACQLVLYGTGPFSRVYAGYAVVVTAVFMLRIARATPRSPDADATSRGAPPGILYVVAVDLGILGALALAAVAR
jgi:hypothetical protein